MMLTSAQWIKRNMLGTYSEELGRPLTEAELRVQRCLEQMSVPDWYQKYSRPPNFRKNCTPIESRPASWKTYKKTKNANTPRKSPKKRSGRSSLDKSPRKTESVSSRTSTADSGYNGTYNRASRRTSKKKKDSFSSCSPCTSEAESDSPKVIHNDATPILDISNSSSNKSLRSPLNTSNSYPRMNRSRKIQNINIVFPKPFPSAQTEKIELEEPVVKTEPPQTSTPKTLYTMTKNFELQQNESCSADDSSKTLTQEKTHTSFLIAEVEPSGVTTRLQLFAGPISSCDSSSDEESSAARCSPSPDTKFFNSAKKSRELEKIVQSRRTENSSGLIQEIIGELDRSILASGRSSSGTTGSRESDFVKSMVSALEQSCCYNSDEEDRQSSSSTDSDLAKSVSLESYSCADSSYSDEDGVHWISCKPANQLPRTSSLLSMLSKRSGRSGRSSPGLSPIKLDSRREEWLIGQGVWGATYNARDRISPRQLFRIDETGVLDSGYSDRSTAPSSRTTTLSSKRRSPSPISSSASSTPTPVDSLFRYDGLLERASKPGPYVLKSILV